MSLSFKIKRNSRFIDVVVIADNTKIELGLFDEKEARALLEILQVTAEELAEDIQNLPQR
jgi:hypothetical protein